MRFVATKKYENVKTKKSEKIRVAFCTDPRSCSCSSDRWQWCRMPSQQGRIGSEEWSWFEHFYFSLFTTWFVHFIFVTNLKHWSLHPAKDFFVLILIYLKFAAWFGKLDWKNDPALNILTFNKIENLILHLVCTSKNKTLFYYLQIRNLWS